MRNVLPLLWPARLVALAASGYDLGNMPPDHLPPLDLSKPQSFLRIPGKIYQNRGLLTL